MASMDLSKPGILINFSPSDTRAESVLSPRCPISDPRLERGRIDKSGDVHGGGSRVSQQMTGICGDIREMKISSMDPIGDEKC